MLNGAPLRVLFIAWRPAGTPAMSVHGELMRHFDAERVEVHVVYNRLADEEPWRSDGTVLRQLPDREGIVLRAADFGPANTGDKWALATSGARAVVPALAGAGGLVRHVRRHRIDIVHCEEGARDAFYAYTLARLTPAKALVHFHAQYGDWMSPLSRFGVRHADALIAVSDWTGAKMAEGGVPSQRIRTVVNGVDPARWDPDDADGARVRRELGIAPDAPLVVMVAQLVAWKRQHLLIDAFRHVVAARPEARLLLVGSEVNQAASDSYTQRLQAQIGEAGLAEHVTLTGRRSDVRDVLAAADVFCLPSVGDPCALAHLEAMAMAKPDVAVRAGGAPELVEHGVTGLLATPDDPDELAANLLRLIDDPDLRVTMGHAGRRRVLEHLNARRMTDDVEAVYRELLGR